MLGYLRKNQRVLLVCCGTLLQSCALIESGLGGQGTTVRKDSNNISEVLAQELASSDGSTPVEPRDTTRSPIVGPSGQERTPLDGSKLESVSPGTVIVKSPGGITGGLLGESVLRTTAVTAEHREAFASQTDGFVRLEDSLYNHILTAPFELYRVTKTTDGSEAGTLRYGLQSDKTTFIIFDPAVFPPEVETSITLVNGPLNVRSGKSLVSIGGKVVIRTPSNQTAIMIRGQRQIAIRNLIFEVSNQLSGTTGSVASPVIRLEDGATDVWIDQNAFRSCSGACVEIGDGVTTVKSLVSISRNEFVSVGRAIDVADAAAADENGTPQPRSGPSREYVRVSVYDNVFREITSVALRVRLSAYVHAFNNHFLNWLGKAIVTEEFGRVYSESNIYSQNGTPQTNRSVEDLGGCSDSDWDLYLGASLPATRECFENVFAFVEDDEPHTVADVDGLTGSLLNDFLATLLASSEAIEATLNDLGKGAD